jgi:hypothetical protein
LIAPVRGPQARRVLRRGRPDRVLHVAEEQGSLAVFLHRFGERRVPLRPAGDGVLDRLFIQKRLDERPHRHLRPAVGLRQVTRHLPQGVGGVAEGRYVWGGLHGVGEAEEGASQGVRGGNTGCIEETGRIHRDPFLRPHVAGKIGLAPLRAGLVRHTVF